MWKAGRGGRDMFQNVWFCFRVRGRRAGDRRNVAKNTSFCTCFRVRVRTVEGGEGREGNVAQLVVLYMVSCTWEAVALHVFPCNYVEGGEGRETNGAKHVVLCVFSCTCEAGTLHLRAPSLHLGGGSCTWESGALHLQNTWFCKCFRARARRGRCTFKTCGFVRVFVYVGGGDAAPSCTLVHPFCTWFCTCFCVRGRRGRCTFVCEIHVFFTCFRAARLRADGDRRVRNTRVFGQ